MPGPRSRLRRAHACQGPRAPFSYHSSTAALASLATLTGSQLCSTFVQSATGVPRAPSQSAKYSSARAPLSTSRRMVRPPPPDRSSAQLRCQALGALPTLRGALFPKKLTQKRRKHSKSSVEVGGGPAAIPIGIRWFLREANSVCCRTWSPRLAAWKLLIVPRGRKAAKAFRRQMYASNARAPRKLYLLTMMWRVCQKTSRNALCRSLNRMKWSPSLKHVRSSWVPDLLMRVHCDTANLGTTVADNCFHPNSESSLRKRPTTSEASARVRPLPAAGLRPASPPGVPVCCTGRWTPGGGAILDDPSDEVGLGAA
mmetsp:Transcript_66434/g.170996  ORF Transcript_66434/g.170996 Transcript_66434/m.170996 type:complete len:313 (+) Transcript_66434:111-1049(+)